MQRIPFWAGLFCTLAFVTPAYAVDKPVAARPNIVFVYTDDQAPTAIGLLNPEIKTPNMDRLFRSGARLENAFVVTPVCSPSRAELMTSRYGTELGITDWINPRTEAELGLDPEAVTWPELLSESGYATGLVGKWHLGTAERYHPTRFGFDEFIGFVAGGASPRNPTLETAGETRQFEGLTPDILTDHALAFLRKHRQRPFLLCLHFRAPHAPWLPVHDDDWKPYAALDPAIPNPEFPRLDVPRIQRMTREYYASVSSVDRNLGRLLDELDRLTLAAGTIVIFTSDHGYNLGHNGVWYKGNAQWQLTELPPQEWPGIGSKQRPNLFDQSLRVPTAIRWPGVIAPGTVVRHTFSNLDWFPTLLAMASVPMPQEITIRGRDATPLLRGEDVEWNDDLYAEYDMHHGATTQMRAYRTPEWKLMIDFHNRGREELYDLQRDPSETTNLADSPDPAVQRVRRELAGRIHTQMRLLGDSALPPE